MNLRNLDAPGAVTYLDEVKAYLKGDHASFNVFRQKIAILLQCSSYQTVFHEAVITIANILRANPQLFRGLNSILMNGDRIESPNNSQVILFVLIAATSARICSSSPEVYAVPEPSTTSRLLDVVVSNEAWTQLAAGGHSVEYLTCLSQLLQVLLDTEPRNKATVYRCLRDLGDIHSILPPSIFLNHVRHQGQQFHAKQGGASSDIFMSVIKGTPICFRVLRMFDVPEDERKKLYKKFCNEVLVWRQLKHPNVLPLLGANTESFRPQFCFISYWMNNGNIMSYLKKNPGHDRLAAVADIVAGIDYLHHLDPPVTHNDLKGANVLVTDTLTCCLADFGLSSILESQRLGNKSPTLAGSICWMAPELMTAGEPYSDPNLQPAIDRKAGDIFALGCTIFEIYTGKPPHHNCPNLANVIYAVSIERKRPALPPPGHTWTDVELDMWWVVDQCWAHEPSARPEIHLVKANLEALMVMKMGKVDCSPSPSKTVDVNRDLVSASEWAKALQWLQAETVTKLGDQEDSPPLSLKRIRTTVLSPIQVEGPTERLLSERYPTPTSPTIGDRRRARSFEFQNAVDEGDPSSRLWTRFRPPSPHPRILREQSCAGGLPTPPLTPSVPSSPPPLPPTSPSSGGTHSNCPLDLDFPRYPRARTLRPPPSFPQRSASTTLRRANPLRPSTHLARWRNAILIESDCESNTESSAPGPQYSRSTAPVSPSPLR